MSDFFDTIGKRISDTVDDLGKKAGDTIDIQKKKNEIYGLKRDSERDMTEIGRLVYERFKQGEAVSYTHLDVYKRQILKDMGPSR